MRKQRFEAVTSRVAIGLLAVLVPAGMALAASTAPRETEPAAPPQDGLAVHDLGVIEQSGSVGPPAGGSPFAGLGMMYPLGFTVSDGPQTPARQPFLLPATPESALPGTCVGGANDGLPCTAPANCPAPGVCNFYRTAVYQNEASSGFSTTATPRNPVLDDLHLAGLSFPPGKISSVEFGFVTEIGGIPSGSTMRVEIRFWDTLNTAVSPVNSGFIGGGSFLVPGPLAGTAAFTFIGTLNPATLPAPSDPNLAIQFDYRDNVSNALAYATVFFSNGTGTGPEIGTSDNLYYRDVNSNGQFDSTDARSITAPNIANFYLHLGGEYPTVETEPNDTQGTATPTASCLSLDAAISPVGDVDVYKFTLPGAQTTVMRVLCDGALDDSTLTLRDGGFAQIDFNDDTSGSDLCSTITSALAAGTYYLEVHEKGDNGTIPSYHMAVAPPSPLVTGFSWTSKTHFTWDAGPAPYDYVLGDLTTLHTSGITASNFGCFGDDLATPGGIDPDTPAPGEGVWYLARGTDPCTLGHGSYDSGGAGQVASRDPLIAPDDCP